MKCPLCDSKKIMDADMGFGCPKCGIAFSPDGAIYNSDWSSEEEKNG